MIERSVEHATFVIERTLAVGPQRVFAAWSNEEEKRGWFACHDDWVGVEYGLDFRVGGHETNKVVPPGGEAHTFRARYLDIVTGERIIYAYQMYVGERRISVSLATVVFEPVGAGTRMIFTEQAAFLDGYRDDGSRRQGTEEALARLGLHLMDKPTGELQ